MWFASGTHPVGTGTSIRQSIFRIVVTDDAEQRHPLSELTGRIRDALALAGRLANPAPEEAEQVAFRRSTSTAYCALFHFLIQDAVQNWNGSSTARFGLERGFEQGTMKEVVIRS